MFLCITTVETCPCRSCYTEMEPISSPLEDLACFCSKSRNSNTVMWTSLGKPGRGWESGVCSPLSPGRKPSTAQHVSKALLDQLAGYWPTTDMSAPSWDQPHTAWLWRTVPAVPETQGQITVILELSFLSQIAATIMPRWLLLNSSWVQLFFSIYSCAPPFISSPLGMTHKGSEGGRDCSGKCIETGIQTRVTVPSNTPLHSHLCSSCWWEETEKPVHEDVGERTRFPFHFMTLDTEFNVSNPFLKGDDNNIYQGCCKVQNLNTSCMFAVVLTRHRGLIIAGCTCKELHHCPMHWLELRAVIHHQTLLQQDWLVSCYSMSAYYVPRCWDEGSS